jgi:ribonuclease HII
VRPTRLTTREIAQLIEACEPLRLPALLRRFAGDDRAGVQTLLSSTRTRLARDRRERARLETLFTTERTLHARGLEVIAGVDEVGRGALAGPLATCAVVLDPDLLIEGLDDSKRLTRAAREEVSARVRRAAVAWCVAWASAREIDGLGVAVATRLAWGRAVEGLSVRVDHVLLDGNDGRIDLPVTTVVGGDRTVACIAAASVVAKVARDRHMRLLAADFPGYGLEVNSGYGTAAHLAAIAIQGPCAEHRRSFAPCSEMTLPF